MTVTYLEEAVVMFRRGQRDFHLSFFLSFFLSSSSEVLRVAYIDLSVLLLPYRETKSSNIPLFLKYMTVKALIKAFDSNSNIRRAALYQSKVSIDLVLPLGKGLLVI